MVIKRRELQNRIRWSIAIITVIGVSYITILIYPNPLFDYNYAYKQFSVFSDKPITPSVEYVIDDALCRLEKSELLKKSTRFRLFICNEDWRFTLLTRNKNAGGLVNFPISPNIFIRKSEIGENAILPSDGWMFTPHERPLSYFIAHEATHSMQRKISPWLRLTTPRHILEGYADYIGKSPDFDYEKYKILYANNDFVMNTENGLYNKYHLYMAYLIDVRKMTFQEILIEEPELESVLSDLSYSPYGK